MAKRPRYNPEEAECVVTLKIPLNVEFDLNNRLLYGHAALSALSISIACLICTKNVWWAPGCVRSRSLLLFPDHQTGLLVHTMFLLKLARPGTFQRIHFCSLSIPFRRLAGVGDG